LDFVPRKDAQPLSHNSSSSQVKFEAIERVPEGQAAGWRMLTAEIAAAKTSRRCQLKAGGHMTDK
jgi:hypothetical protein